MRNLKICKNFLEPFEIVGFDTDAAEIYAKIRFILEKNGRIMGPNDLLIAATVMSHKGILVTHNVREFSCVEGLHVEDWVREES